MQAYQKYCSGRNVVQSEDKLLHLLTGLSSEAGEVNRIFQKYLKNNPDKVLSQLIRDNQDDIRKQMTYELGDVMWYVSELATYFGIHLDMVLSKNESKLEERHGQKSSKR